MRATSFSRTVEPSALARSTIWPNCSTVVSCPRTTTVADIVCASTAGRSPMVPEATCAFCAAMAAVTSVVASRRPTSRAGSIQMRMARSVPNSCACPTPGTRWISGSTLRTA
jgi:hypothetical protein